MSKFSVWRWSALALLGTFLCACGDDDTPTKGAEAYDLKHPGYFGSKYNIPEDNPTTVEGVDLGRHLFYEPMLSLDSSVSCGSCHKQEFAFADDLAVAEGIDGQKGTRSTMALANLLWSKDFFWDGRAGSLEEQALMPIENPVEMNLSLDEAVSRLNGSEFYREKFKSAFGTEVVTKDLLAKAIAQFERSLISGESKYDLYKQGNYTMTDQERLGEQLFFTHPEPSIGLRGANCGDCHSGFLLQTNTFFSNNGLAGNSPTDIGREEVTNDASDRAKFKVVSLRNIALTAPYMHDGRFATLEEVLDHYNEHIQQSQTLDPLIIEASNKVNGTSLELTQEEKEAVIAFLKLLSDEEFISNPAFSDPFK